MWIWSLSIMLAGFGITTSLAQSFGYMQMCSDGQLEGFAIFDQMPASDQDQIVAFFKANRVWTVSRNELIDAIQDQSAKLQLINAKNGYDLNAFFPDAPQDYKKVVSLFGLKQADPLHNNLLIFEKGQLSRFGVKKASLEKLEASQISKHKTRFWPHEVVLHKPEMALLTMSGSKLLLVNQPNFYKPLLYSLNDKNLDFPPAFTSLLKEPIPFAPFIISSYKVASRQNSSALFLSLLWTGHLCYDLKCTKLSNFVDCDPAISTFISGFAHWLQYQTNLTFRLLSVALISIMIVNSLVAIIFVTNQIDKLTLLT